MTARRIAPLLAIVIALSFTAMAKADDKTVDGTWESTFKAQDGTERTTTFKLKQEGDKVRLTLTHSKLPDRSYALGISGGWHAHLDVLEYQLKNEIPPGFWDIWRKYDGVYDKRYG